MGYYALVKNVDFSYAWRHFSKFGVIHTKNQQIYVSNQHLDFVYFDT